MRAVNIILFPLLYAGFATVIWWLRDLRRRAQFRNFAVTKGCNALPHSSSKLPWGIDRMVRMVKLTAQHADVMEEVIMPGFREFGWTFSSAGLMGVPFVMTAQPENLKAIFSTSFEDFLAGEARAGPFNFMLGPCIFTRDGSAWEHSRALFRPHFAHAEINHLEATEEAVEDLITALTSRMDGNDARWTQIVDLQALFLRFTLDTGTEFLFGVSIKSQLAALSQDVGRNDSIDGDGDKTSQHHITQIAADRAGNGLTFSEAFHVASLETIKRAKLQHLFWLANSSKARQAVTYLRRFIDTLIQPKLDEPTTKPDRSNIKESSKHATTTLLAALAHQTQDPIEIRNQTLFMLTASRDTTAALLSWVFLMLAKHPTILHKLRTEISHSFVAGGTITYYSLKKCLYLQWVMLETLRLYPPGPLNSRVAARDTVLPTGGGPNGTAPVAIQKGQIVNLCVYALHRRTDLWGEDALEFRPERWEHRKSDWSFLPFSGGPRTCLGKDYALTEAAFVIVRLLQHFDSVESADDLTQIPQFVTTTLEPRDGVKLRLRRA